MPKMRHKEAAWLLCATILYSLPVYAETSAMPGNLHRPEAVTAGAQKSTGFLLEDAIARALSQSPRLKGFAYGLAAAKGEQDQAGVWENPEIGVEAGNVAGTGPYKGFDSAEVTVGVSQEFQPRGKISARKGVAGKGVEIALLEAQGAALDVIRDVTAAYAEAVAAEEIVRLATEQKELAEDVLKSVSIRVAAAAAPLFQKSRAEVERAAAAIALDKAIRERDIARKKLAVLMGEESFIQPLDAAAFFAIAMPGPAALEEGLEANPDIVKLNSSLEQSRARFDLEKAGAIPGPRLSVGLRDFRDGSDQAIVAGVSWPIPVFNANRGNITKARSAVSRTELDNQQFRLNAAAELSEARERMENAYLQVQTLNSEILPSADRAFRLAREGYGLGRFPYLEVLDAQRSLSGVRQQQIAALKDFHAARAGVERLTAAHMGMIQNAGEQNDE